MASEEVDVLIVGGGPVGLAMASELSYRGVKAILIEKSHTTSSLAKAIAVNSRSMEHFRRLGLQEHVQESSYPRDTAIHLNLLTSAVGNEIWAKKYASWGEIIDGTADEFPFYQPGASITVPMFIPQFTLEPLLKESLEASSCVKLYWGWRVASLTQDEDGVMVKAVQVTPSGEEAMVSRDELQEKVFKAKYLVGCDGGSSFLRKQLGIHTFGKFVICRVCSITFRSPELYAQLKELDRLGISFIINDQFSAMLFTLNTKGEFVLHIALLPYTSDEVLEGHVRNASQCVVSVVGANLPHTILAVSCHNMHSLLPTKHREGRCFLAGDSTHQRLPSDGVGLNTGLSDVADLAWKLEAVLKGYGGPYLLDSYQSERRPIADANRRSAHTFGHLSGLSTAAIQRACIRKILVSTCLTRFLMGQFYGSNLNDQLTARKSTLGFQYSISATIVHERDSSGAIKLNSSPTVQFVSSSLPGCRAPHVSLPAFASIMDIFGKEFVLLIIGGEETDLKALKTEMKNRGVPFSAYSFPKLPELIARYDRKYFLVRPDGVVAWRSDFQPSPLEARKIMSTVLGDETAKRISTPRPKGFDFPLSPSVIFDSFISASASYLLLENTELTFSSALGIGMGIFWMLRSLRTRRRPQHTQQVSHHRAVVCNKFGVADEVLQIEPRFVGEFHPNDVLVRVHAASINPIDLGMRRGYAAPLFHKFAHLTRGHLFPLVLGRDCCGEVVAVGDNVTKFVPGDFVYGAGSMARQGTHAQYVAIREEELAFKPCNVDPKEAAALPWVAVTTWTALVQYAGLNKHSTRGKRILVHSGTGGVGSFAVQLLKAWGAEVTTTCSANNVALAHYLGADKVIDYTSGDFATALRDYDVVFDTVGIAHGYEKRSLSILKRFGDGVYVSIRSPKFSLATKFSCFFGGLLYSWLYRMKVIANRLFFGRAFYYSIAEPNGEALEVVRQMVERGEIRPLIDAVYTMDEIIAAHQHVEGGHTRGKVIVTMV